MIKQAVYILILLLFTAGLSSANNGHIYIHYKAVKLPALSLPADTNRIKTIPQSRMELPGVKKIKEIAKARHQSKPEKVVAPKDTSVINKKAKRQRRPEGLERPPEIPRRNND